MLRTLCETPIYVAQPNFVNRLVLLLATTLQTHLPKISFSRQ